MKGVDFDPTRQQVASTTARSEINRLRVWWVSTWAATSVSWVACRRSSGRSGGRRGRPCRGSEARRRLPRRPVASTAPPAASPRGLGPVLQPCHCPPSSRAANSPLKLTSLCSSAMPSTLSAATLRAGPVAPSPLLATRCPGAAALPMVASDRGLNAVAVPVSVVNADIAAESAGSAIVVV